MRVAAYVTAAMVTVRAGPTAQPPAATPTSTPTGTDAWPPPVVVQEEDGRRHRRRPWGLHNAFGGMVPPPLGVARAPRLVERRGGSIEAPRSAESQHGGAQQLSEEEEADAALRRRYAREFSVATPPGGYVEDFSHPTTSALAAPLTVVNATTAAEAARLDALYEVASSSYSASSHDDTGVFRAYFAGAKKLWSDVAEWRRLTKTKSDGELTWRERRVVRNTPRHLARMFPILVNPLPPPLGFVLIGIASAAPRLFLTPEFWTLRQCERFAARDASATQKRYAKVMAECKEQVSVVSRRLVGDVESDRSSRFTTAGEEHYFYSSSSYEAADPAERTTNRKSHHNSETVVAGQLTSPSLAAIVEPFADSAPLGLDALSRRHLVRLARAARPRPFNRWLIRLTRTRRIRDALRRAASAVDADDDRLQRDFLGEKEEERPSFAGDDKTRGGTTAPSSQSTPFDARELIEICATRGLNVHGTNADRARRIKAWLDARAALVHAYGAPLPASFVLHLPALFSVLIDHADL